MRPPSLLLSALVASAFAGGAYAQAPSPAGQPLITQQVTCGGDEPFWQFDATRTTGVLQRTGGKARQVVEFRGELRRLAAVEPPSMVWRGSSTHLPNDTLVAVLREEACKSTMADTPPLPWRAIVSVRAGETLAGCCTLKRGYDAAKAPLAAFASKPEEDWSRRYPELAAPIQRCVNDSGVTVREVAKAWSAGADAVAVRLLSADGKAWTCTVGPNARARPTVVPVAAGDAPLAGANQPVYYPPREAPIVACGRLERIAGPGARARTEGWLHYDRC
jgi:uncharacterized membrane protein